MPALCHSCMVTDGAHSAHAQDLLDQTLTDGASFNIYLTTTPSFHHTFVPQLNWATLLLYRTII